MRITIFLLMLPVFLRAQTLTRETALADIDQFKSIVEDNSSYYRINDEKVLFDNACDQLISQVSEKESIELYQLIYGLEKVMSVIPDRHANIKHRDFEEDEYDITKKRFPIALARWGHRIIGLKYNKAERRFDMYDPEYPYLHAIDGTPIGEFIDKYAYRRKRAPLKSELTLATKDLRDIGELYLKQDILSKDSILISFSNEEGKIRQQKMALTPKRKRWIDLTQREKSKLASRMLFEEEIDFDELFEVTDDSIGVFTIPAMVSEDKYPGITTFLMAKLDYCRHLKGVVIDIRDNGGGSREILQIFAPYLVQRKSSPWVANVAYVRASDGKLKDNRSMDGRYLYTYDSPQLDDADRAAIDRFKKRFKPGISYPKHLFTEPYYMVLNSGPYPLSCPIVILSNEKCFSAATVFISAFKGLDNVTIMGVTGDGSSGRSQEHYLNNSNIRVKVSTMISLQRNGLPLDGNGTDPDIEVERSLDQVRGLKDVQMEGAIRFVLENLK